MKSIMADGTITAVAAELCAARPRRRWTRGVVIVAARFPTRLRP